MRVYLWAAILGLLLCTGLYAQATGEVESVGFQGKYRPDCWTPMLIRLTPKTDTAVNLEIRVYQSDMDRDRMVAVKKISLTPSVDGRGGDQRFWMYFRPQPVDRGLSDPANGGDKKTLEEQLKVVLCDSGGRVISRLPLTQVPHRVDDDPAATTGRITPRPVRLVLCVSDTMYSPTWRQYEEVEGLNETPDFVTVSSRDLPEDARGYEGVDAIVWLNAPAPDPHKSAEELRYKAIEQFVRRGGMLAVCQTGEVGMIRGFEEILPVTDIQTRETDDLSPLPQLTGRVAPMPKLLDAKYRVGFAHARPGARVEMTRQWGTGADTEQSPFLARCALGMGCVTWVAQDLSEPGLQRLLRTGWVRVWDAVLGWRNDPQRPPTAQQGPGAYTKAGPGVDVGQAVQHGQSMTLRVSAYVLLAVGFFVAYWIVAGPGLTLFLGARKLATFNWFAFGAVAVVAAALSLVVTKLIQSQSPKLDHITIVRVPEEGPASVQSRVGLYVPSDGPKRLELSGFEPHTVNWITPFPAHPHTLGSDDARFLAMKEYELPIEDAATVAPVRVDIPWRSTQKRLETQWTGRLDCHIEGQASFMAGVLPELYGVLINKTGVDLSDVFLVYSAPSPAYVQEVGEMDRVVYIPRWPAGKTLELSKELDPQKAVRIGRPDKPSYGLPGSNQVVDGLVEPTNMPATRLRLREGWVNCWYSDSRMGGSNFELQGVDDSRDGYRTSLPLLSLLPRIPPMRNSLRDPNDKNKTYSADRRDVLRLNGRVFDVSSAVAAGKLVIMGHSEGPMPVPLELDGQKIGGAGVVFYQFVMPLERK